MPRPGPRMEQVAVRLDAETLAKLDTYVGRWAIALATSDGSGPHVTRSDVIRAALEKYLR